MHGEVARARRSPDPQTPRTDAMDLVLMTLMLALVALVLILFNELRNAQRRIDDMRGDVESRIRQGLLGMVEPVARIPLLEQRLIEVEREVAVLQPPQANSVPGRPGGV